MLRKIEVVDRFREWTEQNGVRVDAVFVAPVRAAWRPPGGDPEPGYLVGVQRSDNGVSYWLWLDEGIRLNQRKRQQAVLLKSYVLEILEVREENRDD